MSKTIDFDKADRETEKLAQILDITFDEASEMLEDEEEK